MSSRRPATDIGGLAGAHDRKLEAAACVQDAGLALTLNFVIRRHNASRVAEIIDLAVRLGADRLEVAHAQYYGWALENRAALMPTREQLEHTTAVVEAARLGLRGRLVIDYVVPNYYAMLPKACMGGWGQQFINIDPACRVLSCHAATTIPGMVFATVHERSLEDIWVHSEAFGRFRGMAWMPEPCAGCERAASSTGARAAARRWPSPAMRPRPLRCATNRRCTAPSAPSQLPRLRRPPIASSTAVGRRRRLHPRRGRRRAGETFRVRPRARRSACCAATRPRVFRRLQPGRADARHRLWDRRRGCGSCWTRTLVDLVCARVHDLPLSEKDKKRSGIDKKWCTPEVSAALRAKLGLDQPETGSASGTAAR